MPRKEKESFPCNGRVFKRYKGLGGFYHRCHSVKTTRSSEDGKFYCAAHLPEVLREKEREKERKEKCLRDTAPEMLEALKEVERSIFALGLHPGDEKQCHHCLLKQWIQHIIAKGEGRE